MKRNLAVFIAGYVFAIGLGVSGMTDANKVIGFLNLGGAWDPSLAFVMVGAIGMHISVYRLILKREAPLAASDFHIPQTQVIDRPLILGASIFGVGWGLGGFCPGPAVVSTSSLGTPAIVFTACMVSGMLLHRTLQGASVPSNRLANLR